MDVFRFTRRPAESTRCSLRFSATPFAPISTAATRCTASPLTATMEIRETRASRARACTRRILASVLSLAHGYETILAAMIHDPELETLERGRMRELQRDR